MHVWILSLLLPACDGPPLGGTTTVSDDTAPDETEHVGSSTVDPTTTLWLTELVADNRSGLTDQDGDTSDWVELFNSTAEPIDLAGWYLTDDPDDLSQWAFPAVELPPAGFLVVFASGKDRLGDELHTSFSLSSAGDDLLLVEPDGQLVHHAWQPAVPPQETDISYGLVHAASTLVAAGSALRVRVPESDDGGAWTELDYDDSGWLDATAPVGFAVGPTDSWAETFDTDTTDLAADYPDWRYATTGEGEAQVVSGRLLLKLAAGGANTDAVVDGRHELPLSVSGSVGVSGSDGAGGFNTGLVVGDATVVFHPGYAGGAFRFGTVNGGSLSGNEDVGFTPAVGVQHPLAVAVVQDGPAIQLTATLTNGTDSSDVFTSTATVDAATLGLAPDGTLSAVGFARDGGPGDDAVFDDFDVNGSLEALALGTDLASALHGVSASLQARWTFQVDDPAQLATATLRVSHDDGFVAFLGGVEVASALAPDPLTWDAEATGTQPDTEQPAESVVHLADVADWLQAGPNVLAIQLLNADPTDDDLFLDVSLEAEHPLTGQVAWFVSPTPGARNGDGVPGFIDAEPLADPSGGTFAGVQEVSLTTTRDGAQVVYTVDGSVPGEGDATGSPVLAGTTLVRARVIDADGLYGPVVEFAYVHLAPDLAGFDSPLPILVLENFGAGTVPNKGWTSDGFGVVQVPRQPAHLLLFESAGDRVALLGEATQDARMGVRVRGASSSDFEQPNYTVEFWDDRDRDLAVSPLGMPPDADWVLYHPNPDRDSSLIQNSWTYALSESIGHWAAEFRFAEAFVHQDGGSLSLDDHHGLVVVLEKVKLTPDRLDVTPLSDDGSTGGWLLGINRVDAEPVGGGEPQSFHTAGPDRVYESTPNSFGGGDDIPIQWNAFINFDDPDGYEISDDQRAEIEGWFVDMEDVLYAPGWRDPVTGYAAWLDVEDFIDYFLIHDLTRNTDGLLISLWCYLDDADGRLHMGPPWDYDLAFSDRPESNLLINAQHLWYDRLFDDPAFVDAYAARWQELRTGPFADQELVGLIDSQAAEVSAEVAARTGLDDWPERVDDMADFVVARAAALDALLR